MSDTEQASKTASRPRLHRGRIVGVVVVLGVMVMGAKRPEEHQFISKPTKTSPAFALVIHVPKGWECQKVSGPFEWSVKPGDAIEVRLRPLTDHTKQMADRYTITLQTGPPGSIAEYTVPTLKRFLNLHNAQGGNQTTFRTIRHPLGPAFEEMCAPGSRSPVSSAVFSIPEGKPERHRATHIFLRKHPASAWVYIKASDIGAHANFRRVYSAWDEIVRSIRVVQK